MAKIIDFQEAKRRLVGGDTTTSDYRTHQSSAVNFRDRKDHRKYDDYVEGSTENMRGYLMVIEFPRYWDEALLGFTERDRLYIAYRGDQRGLRRKKVKDHEEGHHKYGSNESLVRAATGTRMDDPSGEFYVHRRAA